MFHMIFYKRNETCFISGELKEILEKQGGYDEEKIFKRSIGFELGNGVVSGLRFRQRN